ncbi:MAG TPA: FAD-dependent oxidoreductase, partial [Saprospiraceae bacterium]|nr:FAD-dependent oxidoreductase [Saprospiraceae bacterium]
HKLWQLMTSCYERRRQYYEKISWWQYTEADRQCTGHEVARCPYQEYFVGGLTHTLVAAQPTLMSTKTGGDILLQLIFLMTDPETQADRVLNAPTNDAWLNPWYKYLTEKGVQYHHGHTVREIKADVNSHSIKSVLVESENGQEREIVADAYISCLPVERMAPLVNESLVKIDKTLENLIPLSKSVNWMNGIQFYLDRDVKLTNGHVIFLDSPWAVTAISQLQFWEGFDIEEYGNGRVKGILSVDVSDWNTPGLNGKRARDCLREEIIDEVWNQMCQSLNIDGNVVLDKSMIVSHTYLDDDIVPERHGGKVKEHNEEKLLVNSANTWSLRPEAYCNVKNLYLASDYVRTNTDLATMEGANEAARRAVNCILSDFKSDAAKCKIWKMHEPNILAPLRWLDKKRYNKGEQWRDEVPILWKILHLITYWVHRLFKLK